MPILDIAALLAPISEEQPAGENLEYAGVAALERIATGTPGVLDPATREVVGAEEPDWRKVKEAAIAVMSETKDLRAAAILTRALLALHGLQGLAEGLQLVQGMLAQFWDSTYPQLDKDEGDDPVERVNALANLSDPEGMVRALRAARILESREIGNYTPRDLDLASGRISPPEGLEPPTHGLLAAAWNTGNPELNSERQAAVESALQSLEDIGSQMRTQAGDAPDLGELRSILTRVRTFYRQVGPEAPDALVESADEGFASIASHRVSGEGSAGAGARGPAALASRQDAVKALQVVATFVRTTEPSSPAPLFIDRAIKMLQMDFASIVRELMPDSKERIEMLGGISLDES